MFLFFFYTMAVICCQIHQIKLNMMMEYYQIFLLCLFWKGSQFSISTFTNFTPLKALALFVMKKKQLPLPDWPPSVPQYTRLLAHKWRSEHEQKVLIFPACIVSSRVPPQHLPAGAGGGGGHEQQQRVRLRLPWQRPQHQPLHLQAQRQVLQREGCQGAQVPLPQVEVGPRFASVNGVRAAFY